MANLNKLRQNNPHWQPEDGDIDPPSQGFIEDQEAAKQMAEIDHQENLDKAAAEGSTKYFPKPKEFSEMYQEIANKVIDDIEEQLFELINEYSDDYDELYWNRYLTDDAPVELLDAAFENYHEHYDNIFKVIMGRLNNTN